MKIKYNECRNIFLLSDSDENNMVIKLYGCDYTVAAARISMIWMMLCKYTGGSAQRRDIVIICNKTFYYKMW
jgi:hypothetical protein